MVTLQTERMILQALSYEQLSMALHNIPSLEIELNAQIPESVFSDESRQAMTIKISRMEHAERRMHEWFTYFLLLRATDRCALGVCGFKGPPSLFGAVELGYSIHEDYRNTGLMTEAVRALIKWAFAQPGCTRVTAETLRDNFASQRVLQKSGLALDRNAESMIYWKIERQEWLEHGYAGPSGQAGHP